MSKKHFGPSKVYNEVKNVVHNEIGVTKEDILKVFSKMADDDMSAALDNCLKEMTRQINGAIHQGIEDIAREEVRKVVSKIAADRAEEIVDNLLNIEHKGVEAQDITMSKAGSWS